jgi:ankyrin repeat protein
MACSQGDLKTFHAILKDHPEYIQQPPSYFVSNHHHDEAEEEAFGESCLHVAGITGQIEITKAALQAGADPNVPSAFPHGLRMTPLAFHVYGGHIPTIQLLLQAGANVNQDMDHMLDPKERRKATVMDLLLDVVLIESDSQDDEQVDPDQKKYLEIKKLLEQYGAKRYRDLHPPEQEL